VLHLSKLLCRLTLLGFLQGIKNGEQRAAKQTDSRFGYEHGVLLFPDPQFICQHP